MSSNEASTETSPAETVVQLLLDPENSPPPSPRAQAWSKGPKAPQSNVPDTTPPALRAQLLLHLDSVQGCLARLNELIQSYSSERSRHLPANQRHKRSPLVEKEEELCILIACAIEHLYSTKEDATGLSVSNSVGDTWVQRLDEWIRAIKGYEVSGRSACRIFQLYLHLRKPGTATVSDVLSNSKIREHTCAAILSLLLAMHYTSNNSVNVREVVPDLHGGLVKICLGGVFDDCPDLSRDLGTRADDLQLISNRQRIHNETVRNAKLLLAASGLPISTFLIEHGGRLYDLQTKVTHEPALSIQYLERVADAIWTLSTRIFGEGLFSYEGLSDFIREPVTERVKRAAHRIHSALAMSDDHTLPLLWLGRDEWRLLPREGSVRTEQDDRDFDKLKERFVDTLKCLTPQPQGSHSKTTRPKQHDPSDQPLQNTSTRVEKPRRPGLPAGSSSQSVLQAK